MSYIGSKPADAVLETDDIADNVITSAKIVDGTITTADLSFTPVSNPFRNIIINGDMSIAQRGTSTASVTGDGYNTVDRFINEMNTAGTWTQSQSTDVPTGQGFATSLKYDCTTANASLSAGSFGFLSQRFEGQNLQYLKYGTSSAESLTLSFWVKSNKTGTYIVEMVSFATTKSQSQSYTISSADTWEKKTLTFTGDTATAIANSNARSFNLNFWLVAGTTYTSGTLNTSYNTTTNANRAVGQVNLADSTSNEWYITGVQLEAGTSASDFEFLPYDVNLMRCERYCSTLASGLQSLGIGFQNATDSMYFPQKLKQTMRATPSLNQVTGTNYYSFDKGTGTDNFNSITLVGAYSNERYIELANVTDISGTAGDSGFIRATNSSVLVLLEAEL